MRISFILAGIIILLSGCAPQYPLNANLNLRIPPHMEKVYHGATATVEGVDDRKDPEVIIYQLSDRGVRITNLSPPHLLLAERLTGGLRQQGLMVESSSPVHIMIAVKNLLAKVTRPKMLYQTNASSTIQLVLEHGDRTLTKNYNLESSRESLTKPEVDELEELLNTQLSTIVGEILADDKVQGFLGSN